MKTSAKIQTTTSIGIKTFLNSLDDEQLAYLDQLIRKKRYQKRINRQMAIPFPQEKP